MTIVTQKAEKAYTVQPQAENKEVSRSLILFKTLVDSTQLKLTIAFQFKGEEWCPSSSSKTRNGSLHSQMPRAMSSRGQLVFRCQPTWGVVIGRRISAVQTRSAGPWTLKAIAHFNFRNYNKHLFDSAILHSVSVTHDILVNHDTWNLQWIQDLTIWMQ